MGNLMCAAERKLPTVSDAQGLKHSVGSRVEFEGSAWSGPRRGTIVKLHMPMNVAFVKYDGGGAWQGDARELYGLDRSPVHQTTFGYKLLEGSGATCCSPRLRSLIGCALLVSSVLMVLSGGLLAGAIAHNMSGDLPLWFELPTCRAAAAAVGGGDGAGGSLLRYLLRADASSADACPEVLDEPPQSAPPLVVPLEHADGFIPRARYSAALLVPAGAYARLRISLVMQSYNTSARPPMLHGDGSLAPGVLLPPTLLELGRDDHMPWRRWSRESVQEEHAEEHAAAVAASATASGAVPAAAPAAAPALYAKLRPFPSPPPPPPLPPPPPSPPCACVDDAQLCAFIFDSACDDGGAGSEYAACPLATDCTDCVGPWDIYGRYQRCTAFVPPPAASPPPDASRAFYGRRLGPASDAAADEAADKAKAIAEARTVAEANAVAEAARRRVLTARDGVGGGVGVGGVVGGFGGDRVVGNGAVGGGVLGGGEHAHRLDGAARGLSRSDRESRWVHAEGQRGTTSARTPGSSSPSYFFGEGAMPREHALLVVPRHRLVCYTCAGAAAAVDDAGEPCASHIACKAAATTLLPTSHDRYELLSTALLPADRPRAGASQAAFADAPALPPWPLKLLVHSVEVFSGDTAAEALAIGMASGGHVVVGSADGRARSMPIYVTLTTADSWRVEVLPASLAWQRFGLGPIEWAGLVGISLFVLVYCCEGPTTRPKLTP